METSRHSYTNLQGYRCGVDIIDEDDDIVVFNSEPHLSFDFRKQGIRIRRSKYEDYVLCYVLKDGQVFLRRFEARLSFFSKKSRLMGVTAEEYNSGKWSIFVFDDIPVDYSGTLSIGRTFDYRYWNHDEKAFSVPFSPEVYKENGYIRIEKGAIVEKVLGMREK